MNRVFIDLDGPVVDFDGYCEAQDKTGDEIKRSPGSYLKMSATEGAIAAVRSIIGMGYDAWIASKPPTGIAFAYADKVSWVLENLPELKRKIILTPDKGLLGDEQDILIDDRPHKANCGAFPGKLIVYRREIGWTPILALLRGAQRDRG